MSNKYETFAIVFYFDLFLISFKVFCVSFDTPINYKMSSNFKTYRINLTSDIFYLALSNKGNNMMLFIGSLSHKMLSFFFPKVFIVFPFYIIKKIQICYTRESYFASFTFWQLLYFIII
jgi:hypothetical protein